MTTANFNSRFFHERGDTGKNHPQWGITRLFVLKKIPGGDLNVIQNIGNDVQRLAMPIQCTGTVLGQLIGDIGATAALHNWSGADTNAYLYDIDPPIEVKPGTDLYQTVLHFIKQ